MVIVDEGEGYSPDYLLNTRVVITGDGIGATAELSFEKKTVIQNGVTVDTGKYKPIITLKNGGKGYTYAIIDVICDQRDGTGNPVIKKEMQVYAIVNPITFLGRNIVDDLNARFVSFKCSFLGKEGDPIFEEEFPYTSYVGNFPTAAPFRQIGLIKNVKMKNGEHLLNNSARYYDVLMIDNKTDRIMVQEEIEGINSGAKAKIWDIESINGNEDLLYLINRTGSFDVNKNDIDRTEYISVNESYVSARTRQIWTSNMDRTSGEFLYIENIKPIFRNNTQKETFLFTIEL